MGVTLARDLSYPRTPNCTPNMPKCYAHQPAPAGRCSCVLLLPSLSLVAVLLGPLQVRERGDVLDAARLRRARQAPGVQQGKRDLLLLTAGCNGVRVEACSLLRVVAR